MKAGPRILKGTRDFLPQQMILRQYIIGTLKELFERYGFEPLETPAIEYAETLEGKSGEEADELMYKFEDRGGRRIGLRYELTVSLARVVAMYPELVKPFKRYQMAPVWRADKPQKGRYREFWQCDIDTIGTPSVLADAEIISIIYEGLRRLGFDHFTIKINNRKILNALAEYAGVPATQAAGIYRGIDKLAKIGPEGVRRELAREGISPHSIAKLMDLLQISGDTTTILTELRGRLAACPSGLEGLNELEEIITYLRATNIPADYYKVDLSMVRGLEYYTGPIYETVITEPRIGSITGGGRYDKLVGILSARDYPATGSSFGLERLIDVIEKRHTIPETVRRTVTSVLVTVFSQETIAASLRLARELREAGINTEIYLETDKLREQMRYAARKSIPFVVVLGPEEITKDVVVLKEMVSQVQQKLPRKNVVTVIQQKLGQTDRLPALLPVSLER
ncbi:MAG: histidine--tRNA ligase [Chloroflexi bacterium]|nr:histidine--tRNA ligase [Chloroflexota bacterium]